VATPLTIAVSGVVVQVVRAARVPVPRCPSEIDVDTRPDLMLGAPPTPR
jgi:hypothetical protein